MQGVAAPSNLSMNQTLEGHNGTVMCLAWNPSHRKLTTSDEKGLIIVWTLHRGMWYEEMINNRNKSVVEDMKWTADGKKICIIYEDGAVIVGSVDGSRLWGKELNTSLRKVEWSPDSRIILFVTAESDILIYDAEGTKLKNMNLSGVRQMELIKSNDCNIVGIDWYKGSMRYTRSAYSDAQQSLCIAYDVGVVLISQGDEDVNPILIDTELDLKSCKWSPDGSVLSVIGSDAAGLSNKSGKEDRRSNFIKFYSCTGQLMRQVRIPGENVNAITWEASSLRIALAVDAFIFFANVRPAYTWAYLENTVVYSYYRPERKETVVIFWDLSLGEAHPKYVSNLLFLCASSDYCALILSDQPVRQIEANRSISGGNGKKTTYTVQLRNSIGAIVHSKTLPFMPKFVSMSSNHVVVANDRTVYTWQFQSSGNGNIDNGQGSSSLPSGSSRDSKSRDRIFDIETISYSQAQPPETFKVITDELNTPITCVTISDRYLIVGRSNGVITRFTLPHLSSENEYTTVNNTAPFKMELSCASTKLAIIDTTGNFSMIDLDAKPQVDDNSSRQANNDDGNPEDSKSTHGDDGKAPPPAMGRRMKVDRRDVWDIKWAEDNDEMLCIMEKTKLQVIRGELLEDPITSSGYIARFKDLEIRAVMLDEMMKQPIEQQNQPPSKELVIDFETKAFRDVREKVTLEGLQAGYQLADQTPHRRLFRFVAETALEQLDLTMAEKSFVRCEEYHAIQLVRQLREMPDKMKARAEVAVYLKRYDEAEAIYREIDRKDLAIQMRKRIGDYPRVVQLLQTGGGNDLLMREAWDKIGEQYADKFKWRKASQYFRQSRNMERLSDCLYRLEMFNELAELRLDIPDGTPLLNTLAGRFAALGMHEEAVDCFIRCSNVKAAIDCCVIQNRWDTALELAETHDYPQVEGLLARYAINLMNKGKRLEAVELYRRANRPTDSALLIGDIAEQVARKDVHPSLAKRLHVLSALEIERHRKRTIDQAANNATKMAGDGTTGGNQTIAMATAATLESLMMTSLDTQDGATATLQTTQGARKASRAFGNAWRGAAAYHYQMLAQKQFYSGNYDAAMKCAIKLCEYDDILNPRDIYSLLALTAYFNKFYGICSQAFVKVWFVPMSLLPFLLAVYT